ncbi:MAG: type II 3-dehydroquinate dehydratase [Psittacicella sp.]
MKILILQGPNLNLLGLRDPTQYGKESFSYIESRFKKWEEVYKVEIISFQTNSESNCLEYLHKNYNNIDYIILNPAAWTHSSIALRDALEAINIDFIEVHLSNLFKREEFRKISYFSDKALGVISGLGFKGYELALKYLIDIEPSRDKQSMLMNI